MNKDDYCLYPGCLVLMGDEDGDSYWCAKHNEKDIKFQGGVFLKLRRGVFPAKEATEE